MHIVLTGGLGFVGQNLAQHLSGRLPGATLTAIDWFMGAAEDERAAFDHVLCDCFASPQALERYEDADVIVHLAARTTVQESICTPLETFAENVVKTQSMLEHIRLRSPKAKLIFASTGGAIVGDHDGAIHEQVNPRPLSPYGASKLAVEGLLSAYQGSYGLRSAAMRFSNVYGPNSRRKSSVVAAFCKSIALRNAITINGDGEQTRDYIYVQDVAEAIARVIEVPNATGVFQLGTGTGTSINTLAGIFQRALWYNPPKILHAPALPGEVRHNRCDIGRIRTELGFNPQWSLSEGVRATLDWFEAERARAA